MAKDLCKLTSTIIYGDVHEVPLNILGDHCPSPKVLAVLDEEQLTRLAIAATVEDYFKKMIATLEDLGTMPGDK